MTWPSIPLSSDRCMHCSYRCLTHGLQRDKGRGSGGFCVMHSCFRLMKTSKCHNPKWTVLFCSRIAKPHLSVVFLQNDLPLHKIGILFSGHEKSYEKWSFTKSLSFCVVYMYPHAWCTCVCVCALTLCVRVCVLSIYCRFWPNARSYRHFLVAMAISPSHWQCVTHCCPLIRAKLVGERSTWAG